MPVADRRYYVSNDRTRVVEEDDAEAGALLAAEGDEISDEDVKKYGIKLGKRGENKAEEASENKAEAPSENKAAGNKGGNA